MSEVSNRCSTIPFLRFGAGDPFVFIHGLGEVKEGWNNQFEFADQYDLIIPDCFEVNNVNLLPKIKVPTLIMGSQYDSVIPVWMQLLMHKKIRHSEFVIVRNTGHIAKLEQKEAFNRILRNFLKKHASAG